MKKKVGIMISVIAALIIIGIGIFAFLYFMTDTFKSSQQLFWQYASNSNQLIKMISSENEVNQKVWKESHSYTAKGDLNIAVTKENGTKEIKLGTTAKHSQNTGRTYSDVTLYNGEVELLKASYINSGDIYALYCKDIYEPYYIGFRNSNVKELASKMGLVEDSMQILNMLSLENGLTKEEILHLLEIYSGLLVDCIPEANYTKVAKTTVNINNQICEAVGYQLRLNQADIRKILIDILTKTKEDEQVISILNKLINAENLDMTSIIEQIIINLQENSLQDANLTITVYNAGKKLTQIQMSYNEEMELILDIDDSKENKKSIVISLKSFNSDNAETDNSVQITMEKQILSNMVLYTSTIANGQDDQRIIMSTSLGNIVDDKIENNSKIAILDYNTTIEATYYKTIQSTTEEVEIQELTNSNAVVINNYPREQLENFFEEIGNKIEEVIPEKIGQLNIQMAEAQDGLYYLEGIVSSVFAVMNANGMPQSISATGIAVTSGLKQAILSINDSIGSSIGNSSNLLAEQEKQIFNQKFELYKGEGINGTLARTLLSNIITNNTSYIEENDRIVKVRLDGNKIKRPENWSEQGESDATKLSRLRNNINVGNKYNIVIEYNTKGFVEIITITEI